MILGAYQPRYLPCLHWWNRMLQSDVFVILDDTQFKRRSWQHRAEIMLPQKSEKTKYLLTIPIDHNTLFKPIKEVLTASGDWWRKHQKTIKRAYVKTPDFEEVYMMLVKHLSEADSKPLLSVTLPIIIEIITFLKIDKEIHLSGDLNIKSKASDRLIEVCQNFGADTYLCGGIAYRSYMELDKFEEVGIQVEVQDWECKYPYGDISIIDSLMRHGKGAKRWIE